MLEGACQVFNGLQPLGRAWIVRDVGEHLAVGRTGGCQHGGRYKETAALHVWLPGANRYRLSPSNTSLPWLSSWRIAAPQLRTALNKPIEANQANGRSTRTDWNKRNLGVPKAAHQCSLDKS